MTGNLDPEKGAILLVDKPVGWTSFNVVAKIRAALLALCKHRVKVGHAGTLDPLASGLLIIGTGSCTRILQGLTAEDKTYTATLRLGQTTPSHDAETAVDSERPWEHIGPEAVRHVMHRFTGTISQRPPDFSAKRFQGERSYFLARKGKPVAMEAVDVTIHRLELLGMQGPEVTLEVHCGKGTYIRSLAHDIGEALGCGAFLSGLRRTGSGDLHVRDARTPDQWSAWLDEWAAGRAGFPVP
ncbi:MAG: tRNA pseudouridine(55) synthase TruB [Flavobacteriales bacterium]|nr:tRNA pseudouridine(55) synthase TruB [Flavobacteriales bacterium]MCL4281882.1 tRNA pseudouridine(55) synthase TruB [Flavobacteriales bacterium]